MNPEEEWRELPEGKEKYNKYLASREWGQLRRRVFERCTFRNWRPSQPETTWVACERCYAQPAKYVHHLTYERKYNEAIEDLLAVCEDCHGFIHGEKDVEDPRGILHALAVHVNFDNGSGSYLPADIICPVCGEDCDDIGKPFRNEDIKLKHIVFVCSGSCGHSWEVYVITREGNTFIASCNHGIIA